MHAKVLVVEDDVDMSALIRASLAPQGFEVKAAFDGECALEAFSEWQPDLILLDVMMPKMNGFEVCRNIRKLEKPEKYTPVILLTALSQIQDKEKGFLAGADDYLTKPFHPSELVLRLQAHLKRVQKSAVTKRLVTPPAPASDVRRAMQNLERFSISVVIPVLNEEAALPGVLVGIPTWVDEVLLVDGHSTDRTVEVAKQTLPSIKVITQNGRGKGDALRYGLASASGDIIITLDGDGSMDPAEIPFFAGALLSGADYVKGSRFLQGAGTVDMPLIRIIGNAGLVLLANVLFGVHYSDITYGYNAIWRDHISCMASEIDGWPHEAMSNIRVLKHSLHVVEIACYEERRMGGQAKMDAFSAGWDIMIAMLREWMRWKREGIPRYHNRKFEGKLAN